MAEKYGSPWTSEEIEVAVSAYFDMLRAQLTQTPYVKVEANRHVQGLTDRTKGSVERKFMNISAVLNEAGVEFVKGYLPLPNVQQALREAVIARWQLQPDLEALMLARAEQQVAEVRPDLMWRDEQAPKIQVALTTKPHRRLPTKVDFLELEARRRDLGRAGEEAVVHIERERLRQRGQDRLATMVEHVSQSKGDGLGYDVLSFDEAGNELFIEVKTTRQAREYPFMVSANEVSFSDEFAEQFSLYRVFDFGKDEIGLYRLAGSIAESCRLTPKIWSAQPA